MNEDREATLCVCGEQNCPDHGSLKGRFDCDHVYDRNISTDGRDECVKCGVRK